jgi:valyl-tRNA synthetase
MSLETTYNPQAIEQHWYQIWEQNGYFTPNSLATANYCIMIPPPNVTGTLHMGHAFQDTLMDLLIRYHRMRGCNTLWQAGTDHAGIATQMVVERQLAAENKTRHDLGREAFVAKVWEWKQQSGGQITRQLRRMGASLDWLHERFTMDEGLSHAVREVFVRLYDEGLIYRGKRLVNWDPVLHTAVSDLEVVAEEENGLLWHLRYPLDDGSGDLIVATTRPETMLGDTAVAVHPDDVRYQQYIGKFVELPLTSRKIPVIADEYVDPSFGSGCVKITPAHDFNDYEVGKRHNLPMINIFTIDAKINEHAPRKYRDLDRYAARKQVIADMESLGLLVKIDAHKLQVPRGDRSGAVIEPFLTDQWYVKIAPLAEPAINAVAQGRIKFIPENWSKTYFEWMRNIEDWCISRQIWWGHRIPAWYDEQGHEYVGYSEAHVRQKYHLAEQIILRQDEDVLDTWFSSALWPFSTLGWPDDTKRLHHFYPSSVLVTGFDIIFFWVARMIMLGLKFIGDVPFREVYIHGLVRDSEGQKMSKSKGNVLDPLDLIDGIDIESLVEKRTSGLMQPQMAAKIEQITRQHYPKGIQPYGTDALRFTFTALASTGRDIRFDLGRIEGYRNFCNKLWNASRYVLISTAGYSNDNSDITKLELSLADRWMLSQLQRCIQDVEQHIQNYRFDLATNNLYDCTWNIYCDWYVEFSKPILQKGKNLAAQRTTQHILLYVLENLLRLLHPFIPFITEELWQKIAPTAGVTGDTIMLQPYPSYQAQYIDETAEQQIAWIQQFINEIRRIRSEMNIAPSKRLTILLQNLTKAEQALLDEHSLWLQTLAKIEQIDILSADQVTPESAIALVGQAKIFIPLAGLIDVAAEIQRLQREMEKIRVDSQQAQQKLDNPKFVARAPTAIVEVEKQRVINANQALQELELQLQKIKNLS